MAIDLYCRCGRALQDYVERINGECKTCIDRSKAPAAVQDEAEPDPEEPETDPVTRRLIDDALKTHGKDCCPKCWHSGRFIRMALVCPRHGAFGGV